MTAFSPFFPFFQIRQALLEFADFEAGGHYEVNHGSDRAEDEPSGREAVPLSVVFVVANALVTSPKIIPKSTGLFRVHSNICLTFRSDILPGRARHGFVLNITLYHTSYILSRVLVKFFCLTVHNFDILCYKFDTN
ncbi:MAG: hypothetical protein Q7K39_01420 [Candidatus Magasanikbacteria bacterium]|nr:hypothetical protein [Candidatus Magasanikbacteria bacterium]